MRSLQCVVSVVIVVVLGTMKVQATPGIMDLFNFESPFGGTPKVRTVYVVKPSHGHKHSHSGPSHSHGRSPKTIIKYVTKPPSSHSSHSSLSPFSIFSNAFSSSSGGGSGGSGWSTLSHSSPSSGGGWGKDKHRAKVVDEETFNKLAAQQEHQEEGGDEVDSDSGNVGGGRSPMEDDVMMNQMFTSNQNENSNNFESEDPNADVEVVNVNNRPQSMRGMRPPPSSGGVGVMMSQGGYSSGPSAPLRSQSSRSRPKPGNRGRGPPPSSMVMQSQKPQTSEPQPTSPFDQDENEIDDGHKMVMTQVRGSGKPNKPKGSSKPRGNSGGWSSGPPKTITYITNGWGGPPKSSHHHQGGWSGWGPSHSSFGWPSSFEDDDYWPLGGSSGGWSSSSSDGETDHVEEQEESPEEPETEMPVDDAVNEVGLTEESEDRRPPRPSSMGMIRANFPERRPVEAAKPSAARRPQPPRPSSSPSPSSSSSGKNRPRPSSGSAATTGPRPTSMSNSLRNPMTMTTRRPRTNEPQPEYIDVEPIVMSPRPAYGVPGQQQQQVISSSSSGSGSSSSNGQVNIGGQVISNQDGLLDEELIRTVQRIIQTFDKN